MSPCQAVTAALDGSFDAGLLLSPQGTVLYKNTVAQKLFETEQSDATQTHVSSFFITSEQHGNDPVSSWKKIVKKIEAKTSFYDGTGFKKDGTRFPTNVSLTKLKNCRCCSESLGSQPYAVCAYIREKNDTRNEQHRLVLAEAAVNAAFNPMFSISEAGTILMANDAAVKQFGWSHDELIGSNISIIAGGNHGKNHDSYLARYLQTGEKRVIGKKRELTAKRKNGSEFPIELGITEVTTDWDERMFCGFVRDLTRQKLNEEELKHRESLTKGMIDSAFDPMFQINEKGIIQIVNQAAVDHFGWTREEFLGKNISMIVGGEHGKNHDRYLARYLETGLKRVIGKKRELVAVRKNGKVFPIQLGLTEVTTQWGEQMFCGYVRDLTRQKLDEEELKHRETLARGMIDSAFDPMFQINSKGIIQIVNQAAVDHFGWSREELIGKNINVIVGGGHAKYHDSYLSRYLKTGEKRVIGKMRELTAKRKDGSEFPIQLGITEVVTLWGEQMFCGYVRDLTRQKFDEEELKRNETLTKGMIDSAFDPMFQINEKGIIQIVNNAATQHFGWHREDFVGKNISMIVGGGHSKNHDLYLSRYLKTGEKRVIGKMRELTAKRKDGSEFPIQLGITEVTIESGERVFCGFVRDLTRQKKHEEELRCRESLTKGMIDSALDPMFQINDRGIIQAINEAAVKQFGWTCEEFIGSNIRMIVGGGHSENHDKYLARYLSTGEKRVMGKLRELTAIRKNSSEFPIQLGLTEVTTESGERMFCGFVRDLTQQKIAEDRIKRKESMMKGMIDSSYDPMFQINDRGIIQMINQAAIDSFGWSRDEFLGSNISMVVGGGHSENHNKYIERYFATGEKRVIGRKRELFAVRKDGSEFPIELGVTEVVTIWDERMFCGFVRDITRQKFDENELKEKEKFASSILETLSEPLFLMEEHGTIHSANSVAGSAFGLTKDSFIRQNISMFLAPGQANKFTRVMQNYARLEKKKLPPKKIGLEAQRKNGTKFPIMLNMVEIDGPFPILLGSFGKESTRLIAAFVRVLPDRKLKFRPKALLGAPLHGRGLGRGGSWRTFEEESLQSEPMGGVEEENIQEDMEENITEDMEENSH